MRATWMVEECLDVLWGIGARFGVPLCIKKHSIFIVSFSIELGENKKKTTRNMACCVVLV